MRTIKYSPSLDIRNIGHLPRGTGAKYLVVIKGHRPDVFIAKRWAMIKPKNPAKSDILISFSR